MSSENNRAERETARTISFNGNNSDPYIIAHDDADQLSDSQIKARHTEYLERENESPDEEDEDAPVLDFEGFLNYLEEKHSYRQIIVADRMLEM
jgi:hypothetical protein